LNIQNLDYSVIVYSILRLIDYWATAAVLVEGDGVSLSVGKGCRLGAGEGVSVSVGEGFRLDVGERVSLSMGIIE